MHEMGLMDAMLRMVSRICKEEKLEHVNKITLEVGELSGIEIHYLTDCYAAVADGTPFEQTELVVETVPGTLHCNDCDIDFPFQNQELFCPECFGRNLTPVGGRDMTIKEIEGY